MQPWLKFTATLIVAGLMVVTLAVLALSANWWLPPLLEFVGANSDLIQGLTDLIQLVLWLVAGAVFLVGLWRSRQVVVQKPDREVIVVTDPDRVKRIIGSQRPPDDLPQARKSYLTHLIDRYRYLDFKGMGVSDRVPLRLPLVELYVPLKARIEMPEGETWARELRLAGRKISAAEAEVIGHRLSEPQPVLALLQQHKGLIILGDPGAGKTTFLKYLALRLATGKGEALGLGARLPILLSLSAYANALSTDDVPLDRFITDYYRDRGVDLPLGSLLSNALAQGKALLLLDGLDEVKDLAQRRIVVERVADFFTVQAQKGNKFVLTSRIVGYREVRPTVEGLAECTLVDFDLTDITEFVDKWTQALERAA